MNNEMLWLEEYLNCKRVNKWVKTLAKKISYEPISVKEGLNSYYISFAIWPNLGKN
jgi:hypothetical protein